MDKKEIDSLDFWAKRIKSAQEEHYSVYVTTQRDWDRILELHTKIIKKEVEGTVLDAGCGYGRMSELFPSNYTGIDFSPDFIELAKNKYPKRAKDFKVADLKKLPFEDSSIDWGICVSIKNMIVDNLGQGEWDLMQKELERVCKNILLLEYTNPHQYAVIKVGYPETRKEYDR